MQYAVIWAGLTLIRDFEAIVQVVLVSFRYIAISRLLWGHGLGAHSGVCQSTYAPPPKMTVPGGAVIVTVGLRAQLEAALSNLKDNTL